MERFELVIAGGGLTAARAIRSYREAGGAGRIALLCAEGHLPYHRPALSKRYLRGETGPPFVEDEAFYRDHGVDVRLASPATAVDPAAHEVATGAGPLRYGRLLIATGTAPRRLAVDGAGLDGVHALRTLDDSARIRAAAERTARAVVVGGGFVGLEVAASLRRLGTAVTLIHRGAGLFDGLGSPALSGELLALYREHDVEVVLADQVTRFAGGGRLEAVETAGGRRVAAGLAVVGVGVVPNVGFLAGSGIALDDGVAVDDRFAASVPDVFAAGDVASFLDPLYGRRRRIEHWSNADYQGGEAGRILAGRGGGYDTVSSFSSEVFDLKIRVLGDTSRFDEVREDGSLADGFLALYGDAGRLVAALTVGGDDGVQSRVQRLIEERAPLAAPPRELAGGVR